MKPPRALVLSALSLGTGSGLRAHYLARALRRLGWETELAAPAGGPRSFSSEMLMAAPALAWKSWGSFDLAVGIKPYPDAWLGLGLARLRGALCVADIDDDDGGYRGGVLGAVTRAIQAPAFRVAPFVSTHHPLMKTRLQAELGAGRVVDLAQGVDLDIFDASGLIKGRRAWRRSQGLERDLILAFTAHLNVACQLEVLLSALAPWLRAHARAVLVVAGGGPDEARFRAMAAPLGRQVRFMGPVSPRQSAELLSAADVSVSAYGSGQGNRYRVPMKVAESLAMGLPVVSNLVPGLLSLKPFIQAVETDSRSFGRGLDLALKPGRGRALRGQAWVRRELDWTRVAAHFLEQLRDRQPLARARAEDR